MGTHRPAGRRGLGNRRLGAAQIVFFVVAAAGPLLAIAGGTTTTYTVTENTGVALSFVLLAPVLALFAVGYAAMSRYITNAGAFYPYVANGIGKSTGTAVSFLTLLAYNSIQIAVHGLFGWSISNWLEAMFGVHVPWWSCTAVMIAVVGALGVLRIDINAKVLGTALLLEVITIGTIVVALLTHPAGGTTSFAPLAPANLFTASAGAVFAFSVAAFTGFEGSATYGEECSDPSRTVGRATYAAIVLTAVLYTVSAFAMANATGVDAIVAASQAQGPGLLFALSEQHLGTVFANTAYVLFLTSQFACLLSFHNAIARYFFALGREELLPERLSRTSKRTGAPIGGSLVQTALALAVVSVFALAGADPVNELFAWLGTTASTGVVIIMIAVSLSVIGFFRRHQTDESAWRRWIAPSLAAILLTTVLGFILVNFDKLLGSAGSQPWRWVLPWLLLLSGLVGFLRAEAVRTRRPAAYDGIGGPVGADVDDGDDEPALLRLRDAR